MKAYPFTIIVFALVATAGPAGVVHAQHLPNVFRDAKTRVPPSSADRPILIEESNRGQE